MPLGLLLVDPKELEPPLLVAPHHCLGGATQTQGCLFGPSVPPTPGAHAHLDKPTRPSFYVFSNLFFPRNIGL